MDLVQLFNGAVQKGLKLGSSSLANAGLAIQSNLSFTPSTTTTQPLSSPLKIWGHFGAFHLSLRYVIHPETGESTGQLVADIYSPTEQGRPTKEDQQEGGGLPLPCTFRWRRRTTTDTPPILLDIKDVHSNVYQLCADDISTTIVVEATPQPGGEPWGTAYAEIGPFDVDVRSRQILDNGIATGSLRFPVKLIKATDHIPSDENRQLVIHIMADQVKLLQPGPMNIGYTRKWEARYGADYPELQLNANHALQFTVDFTTEVTVVLEAISRQQRDLISLAIRCFHARSYIATSAILDIVLAHPDRKSIDEAEGAGGQIELLTLIEKLRAELNRTVQSSERCVRERDRALFEKESLQAEMTDTIHAFQMQLADGNPAYATYRSIILEKSAENQKMQHSLMQTVKQLQTSEETLQRELSKVRDNSNLLVDKHRVELRELKNAFLHTKGRHDNLLAENKKVTSELESYRMEMSKHANKSKASEDENGRIHRTLDDVIAERNRLAKINESITKELEKTRNTSRQEKLKLWSENEHLLQDKQDIQQQVASLSHQLQDLRSQPAVASEESDAKLKEANEQLNQKILENQKLMDEVASLKYRIRKLAKTTS